MLDHCIITTKLIVFSPGTNRPDLVNIVRFSSISHLTKQNFKAPKRYVFFSLKRSLQKREKGTFLAV